MAKQRYIKKVSASNLCCHNFCQFPVFVSNLNFVLNLNKKAYYCKQYDNRTNGVFYYIFHRIRHPVIIQKMYLLPYWSWEKDFPMTNICFTEL